MNKLTWVDRAITHSILIAASAFAVFPVLWILSTSLKPVEEVYSTDALRFIPKAPTLGAYREVLTGNNGLFGRWFLNSFIASAATALVGTVLAAGAAYGFSRFRFAGRTVLGFAFLLTQMFPGAVLLVPLYFLLHRLGLLGSLPGLILAYVSVSLPFSVWMLKGYYDTIPRSLDEAALVDGLGPWSIFWRIVAPLALPGLAVTAFFAFLTAWNEYMFATAFMTGDKNALLPVGMAATFGDQYQTKWHLMAAASILTTVPVLAAFAFAQKYVIGGLTQGSAK